MQASTRPTLDWYFLPTENLRAFARDPVRFFRPRTPGTSTVRGYEGRLLARRTPARGTVSQLLLEGAGPYHCLLLRREDVDLVRGRVPHSVPEHVPEYAKGMRECRRVPADDGVAFYSVSMDVENPATWNRPPDTTVAAFEKIVGRDHERLYGLDSAVKLRDAGFGSVEVISFTDGEAERYRLAFSGLDRICACRP